MSQPSVAPTLAAISPTGSRRVRIFRQAFQGTVVMAAVASVPLAIMQVLEGDTPLLTLIDWFIWLIFALDFLTLLVVSPARKRVIRTEWLCAAVVVLTFPAMPALLHGMGFVRLVRVVRLAAATSRGLRALGAITGRSGLAYVALFAVMVIIAGAGAITVVEPETVKSDFGNGLWWAFVTSTTVGYGDIAPTSLAGRLVAVVIMLAGISMISTLSASIAAYFVAQEEGRDLADLRERLDRLEALLEERLPRGERT